MITGIDVSVYQGTINWQTVAAHAQFAFIRAAVGYHGAVYRDQNIALNWQRSKEAGVMRGAYLYMAHGVNPVDQANRLHDVLGGDLGELPPVVDVEDAGTTAAEALDCVLEVGKLFNRKPIIYTGNWLWPSLGPTPWAADYGLWIAVYPKPPFDPATSSYRPPVPKPWMDFQFWQYSSTGDGHLYGCSSQAVDLDMFNGDAVDLFRLVDKSIRVGNVAMTLPLTIEEA